MNVQHLNASLYSIPTQVDFGEEALLAVGALRLALREKNATKVNYREIENWKTLLNISLVYNLLARIRLVSVVGPLWASSIILSLCVNREREEESYWCSERRTAWQNASSSKICGAKMPFLSFHILYTLSHSIHASVISCCWWNAINVTSCNLNLPRSTGAQWEVLLRLT